MGRHPKKQPKTKEEKRDEDLYAKFKTDNDPVAYTMSKSNIDFVAPKESTEPDEEEIKHVNLFFFFSNFF